MFKNNANVYRFVRPVKFALRFWDWFSCWYASWRACRFLHGRRQWKHFGRFARRAKTIQGSDMAKSRLRLWLRVLRVCQG